MSIHSKVTAQIDRQTLRKHYIPAHAEDKWYSTLLQLPIGAIHYLVWTGREHGQLLYFIQLTDTVADPGGPGDPGPLPRFLRSQIIFWSPNYTLLHTNKTKIFKNFASLRSAQHLNSQFTYLTKNVTRLHSTTSAKFGRPELGLPPWPDPGSATADTPCFCDICTRHFFSWQQKWNVMYHFG